MCVLIDGVYCSCSLARLGWWSVLYGRRKLLRAAYLAPTLHFWIFRCVSSASTSRSATNPFVALPLVPFCVAYPLPLCDAWWWLPLLLAGSLLSEVPFELTSAPLVRTPFWAARRAAAAFFSFSRLIYKK